MQTCSNNFFDASTICVGYTKAVLQRTQIDKDKVHIIYIYIYFVLQILFTECIFDWAIVSTLYSRVIQRRSFHLSCNANTKKPFYINFTHLQTTRTATKRTSTSAPRDEPTAVAIVFKSDKKKDKQ